VGFHDAFPNRCSPKEVQGFLALKSGEHAEGLSIGVPQTHIIAMRINQVPASQQQEPKVDSHGHSLVFYRALLGKVVGLQIRQAIGASSLDKRI
jgi:hypothetical protein